jgi:hypothetical protein
VGDRRSSAGGGHSLDVASLTGQLSQLSTSPRSNKTPPDGKKTVVYVRTLSFEGLRRRDSPHRPSLSLLHFLFMRRSRIKKGIGTSHKVLFDKAAEFSNIFALDNKKPQDLPLGLTFFKVKGSLVDKKDNRVNQYVLSVHCFSPDTLDITSARLSDDRHAVILTVAAPDKFVQDARLDIAHQIATCLDPNHALEKEVELNYVASMTAAYSKADKLLPVEDSDTDIAMKEILCILPPGVQGSNAYFNDGRINLNDRRQLQAFPFIHTKQFDSNDLLNAGLSLYTMNCGTDAITSAQASRATTAAACRYRFS